MGLGRWSQEIESAYDGIRMHMLSFGSILDLGCLIVGQCRSYRYHGVLLWIFVEGVLNQTANQRLDGVRANEPHLLFP